MELCSHYNPLYHISELKMPCFIILFGLSFSMCPLVLLAKLIILHRKHDPASVLTMDKPVSGGKCGTILFWPYWSPAIDEVLNLLITLFQSANYVVSRNTTRANGRYSQFILWCPCHTESCGFYRQICSIFFALFQQLWLSASNIWPA